jgi:hypothetical protein
MGIEQRIVTTQYFQFKRTLVIASILTVLVVGGMFALQATMFAASQHWLEQGVEISSTNRLLFGLAVFWSRLWWLATPFLLAVSFALSSAVCLLKGAFRQTLNGSSFPQSRLNPWSGHRLERHHASQHLQ